MSSIVKTSVTLLIGIILGGVILNIFMTNSSSDTSNQEIEPNKPLYWVAPMDANYRRDKPGKSPMGMDLVAVYGQDSSAGNSDQSAVTISPHVINNLGVRTAPVERRALHSQISTVAYIQYDEDKLVHIHPRVDGWVEQLFVKATGDPVNKGQALYTLYSPQLVNAQKEFVIALNRNNTALIDAAKERLQALQLSEQFIQQLQTTRKIKQTVTFDAPQSGVIDGLEIRQGFYVKPGTTLMSIAQLSQVWAEAEVFERDATRVKSGLQVTMTLDYLPGKIWHGTVDYVYPTLNSKTRTLRARLRFDNPNGELKPNMFARVVIHAEEQGNTLLVPKPAVIRTGLQNRVVLALGEGQFKSVEVKIGRVEDNYIEILEGLFEDDLVVISAQFLIDSESSKNSDFRRMSPNTEIQSNSQSEIWSAKVNGVINRINAQNRVLNISRDAIEKWNRPAETLDFLVADTIDLSLLRQDQAVTFTFEVRDDLLITALEPLLMTQHADHANQDKDQQK